MRGELVHNVFLVDVFLVVSPLPVPVRFALLRVVLLLAVNYVVRGLGLSGLRGVGEVILHL